LRPSPGPGGSICLTALAGTVQSAIFHAAQSDGLANILQELLHAVHSPLLFDAAGAKAQPFGVFSWTVLKMDFRVDSERFFRKASFEGRRNTLCISRASKGSICAKRSAASPEMQFQGWPII